MNLSLEAVDTGTDLSGHEQFHSSTHPEDEARQIVEAKNEAESQPKINLQIANA